MPPSPPALKPQQRQIVSQIIARAPRGVGAHVKRVLEKSALETGIVESGLTNPQGGTGDSAGWRQERRSLYPDPTNVGRSIDRYYSEALKAYRPGIKSGELAAEVQRPNPAYRGRYAAVSGQAAAILGGTAPGSLPALPGGSPNASATLFDQTGYDQARKRQIVAQYLQNIGANKGNPLFSSGLLSTKPVNANSFKSKVSLPNRSSNLVDTNVSSSQVTGTLATLIERASKISQNAKPYQWGGGHQRARGSLAQSFDCSGAVSRVLGINPKVASQFESWGESGPGKHVSIYAKNDHVIMAINGHFFGTSASNPGGGAGWIPLSALSKQYLSQFTIRHPAGL